MQGMALEKIGLENLSAPARHSLFIILILALAGMWYWIYQKPRDEQLASINSKNEKLMVRLQQAATVKAQYAQYQKDLEEIDLRLTAMQAIIPTSKEAAAFLRTVQDMATSSDLKINLFRPKAPVSRDFYYDWPVEVRLEGNYHGLGRFFEKMSRATRIVHVPTITINNIGAQTDSRQTITATGTVTTYFQGELSGQFDIEE
jgi:type IV pilus assembly protein PilO